MRDQRALNIETALRRLRLVFVTAIIFSLAGSLFIRLFPEAGVFFGPYYAALVKTPTWTYMALLPVLVVLMYISSVGSRGVVLLVLWGSTIGGLSEIIGTTTGYPFGVYAYTQWLGPKLFGHVPFFIPLSWFAMSLVSFDLAGRVTRSVIGRMVMASAFMILWDVSLDPAMSRAFPFWYYSADGVFYGMPLTNWVGWGIVSLVIMTGYTVILQRNSAIRHPDAGMFFALNCGFPLGISLIAGMYGAVAIGVIATCVPFVLIALRHRTIPSGSLV